MIIIYTAEGKSQSQIAKMLGCSISTVKRARRRWRDVGESGLVDCREDAGPAAKANDSYAAELLKVLAGTPQDHGHRRPTRT